MHVQSCKTLIMPPQSPQRSSNTKKLSYMLYMTFVKLSEPYTVREVRLHLRHIRDLLKSLDPTDAYNGIEGSSLSFLRYFTEEHVEGEMQQKTIITCSINSYKL